MNGCFVFLLFRKNSGLTFLKKYTEQTARPLCQNARCRLAAGFCLSCFLKISESFGALQSRNAFSFRLLCCAKIFICREKDRQARAGKKKFPEKFCPKLLNRRKICAILFVALHKSKHCSAAPCRKARKIGAVLYRKSRSVPKKRSLRRGLAPGRAPAVLRLRAKSKPGNAAPCRPGPKRRRAGSEKAKDGAPAPKNFPKGGTVSCRK